MCRLGFRSPFGITKTHPGGQNHATSRWGLKGSRGCCEEKYKPVSLSLGVMVRSFQAPETNSDHGEHGAPQTTWSPKRYTPTNSSNHNDTALAAPHSLLVRDKHSLLRNASGKMIKTTGESPITPRALPRCRSGAPRQRKEGTLPAAPPPVGFPVTPSPYSRPSSAPTGPRCLDYTPAVCTDPQRRRGQCRGDDVHMSCACELNS